MSLLCVLFAMPFTTYVSLSCAVLLRLALFASYSSRSTPSSATRQQQQQQQQQQQHRLVANAAATPHELASTAAAAKPVDSPASAVTKPAVDQLLVDKAAAVRHPGPSSDISQQPAAAAASRIDDSTSSVAFAEAPVTQPTAAPQAASGASCVLPPLTGSLLQFNLWATSDRTTADSAASSARCGKTAAAAAAAGPAAVYSEAGWLQDLQQLLPQAQQHL
jgi:hypothetical protein